MNITWKAEQYTNQFSFVPQYGENVLNLLHVTPDMTVLDLGCGNGALTCQIAEKGASVIGMDDSEQMLEQARSAYPDLTWMHGNGQSFTLSQPVDAVFSNAVFHWIDDQDALLSCIFNALKPNGQLVFEMGGKGCAETVHRALECVFAEHGYRYRRSQYFPTIGEYAPLLEQHGFRVEYAALFDRDTKVSGEHGVADWIRMFLTLPFDWENIPQEEREQMIWEAEQCTAPILLREDGWHVDYVRLRMKAKKVG